jgi:predicted Rossmann-fold nucleotide-binding protein
MAADSRYSEGTYNFKQLGIGNVSVNAEVQVLRPEIIRRDRPTAFIAGYGFETYFDASIIDKVMDKSSVLGHILGEHYTIITGHCPGVPSFVANAALDIGGNVIGISPWDNTNQHSERWKSSKIYEIGQNHEPEDSASIVIHTGLGLWHRDVFNVEMTNNHRQIVYAIGGHIGTFHETTLAVAHNTIVGALLGVGGISDRIPNIKRELEEANIKHYIVEDTDPKALVEKVQKLEDDLRKNQEERPKSTPLTELLDTLEQIILVPAR